MIAIAELTTTLAQKAQAKWKESGLSDADAARLGIEVLSAEQVASLGKGFKLQGGIKLPYFNPDGSKSNFFRVRYLEFPGFTAQLEKPQRYSQPSGTLNEVYLPPLFAAQWASLLADPKITLYITEGELKSACGSTYGLPVIGLGGVEMYRSTKRGLDLLPVLAETNWSGRTVNICFDSDAASNPNVVRAQLRLAEELSTRGALPRIVALPPTEQGKKQGLDDFLVAHGKEAFEELVAAAEDYGEAAALWKFNDELVYIRDPGLIIVRDSNQRLAPGNFTQHAYSNRHHIAQISTKQGIKYQKTSTAKRWLDWERRFELERITYAPGQPHITETGMWNMWRGWGCDPTPGDVDPWHRLLDYIFRGQNDVRLWFERWCAYPLQHPGTKLFTSTVMWSVHQGTGKTLLGYTLRNIYGPNAAEIKDRDLHAGFNEWAEYKQFIIGDEVTSRSGKYDEADRIKGLISQEQLRINAKYLPSYVVPDCVNYYFTSNHPDAFFLEDTDRRFFIHEVVGAPAALAFYHEYDKWVHGSGPSHLFHHLLNLDLGDFNPTAPALVTASKRAMIVDNKSDIGLWCLNLREDPRLALSQLGERAASECCLFSAAQLHHAYDPDGDTNVTVNGLARELKRSGFRQVNDGSPVRTSCGTQRLYAIREYAEKTPSESGAHWDEYFGPASKKY